MMSPLSVQLVTRCGGTVVSLDGYSVSVIIANRFNVCACAISSGMVAVPNGRLKGYRQPVNTACVLCTSQRDSCKRTSLAQTLCIIYLPTAKTLPSQLARQNRDINASLAVLITTAQVIYVVSGCVPIRSVWSCLCIPHHTTHT